MTLSYPTPTREITLSRGANANAASNVGTTPLTQASWSGHVEIVLALLAAGANKGHVTNNGSTALSVMCNGARDKIAALLPPPD